MIRAIAIDDEPPALRIIEYYCSKNEQIDLVKTFTDPAVALDFIEKNHPDLLFIDIQMPNYNGLKFCNQLKKKPLVIFTTAFSEYAVEGFNLDAIDYLLKPYTIERFEKAIQKVISKLKIKVKENRILPLRTSYSIQSVSIDNITYIESLDDYITIHFLNERPLKVRMTLKKVSEQLPENEFIRVHRSFVVSLKQIIQVRNKKIIIANTVIPISKKYDKMFFEHFRKN